MEGTLSLKFSHTENTQNEFLFSFPSCFLVSRSHPSLHFLLLLDPHSFSPDSNMKVFLWILSLFRLWKLCGANPTFLFSGLFCPLLRSSAWLCTAAPPSLPPPTHQFCPAGFLGDEICWICSQCLENLYPWQLFPFSSLEGAILVYGVLSRWDCPGWSQTTGIKLSPPQFSLARPKDQLAC